MEILRYPDRKDWTPLCKRALAETANEVKTIVADIIANVRNNGDKALIEYEQKFTGAQLSSLCVSQQEIDEALSIVFRSRITAWKTIYCFFNLFHFKNTRNNIFSYFFLFLPERIFK